MNKGNKRAKQTQHLLTGTSETVSDQSTSSDEFPAFIHQVRGEVIISDVLLEAQEVQTARAQAINTHTQLQIYC